MHGDMNRCLESSGHVGPGCNYAGKDSTDMTNLVDAPHSVGDDRCVEDTENENTINLPNVDTAVDFAVGYGMHVEHMKSIQMKLDDSTTLVSELQNLINCLKSEGVNKENEIKDKMKAEFESDLQKRVDEAVLSVKASHDKELQEKDSLISVLRKEIVEVTGNSLNAEAKHAKVLRDKDDLVRILRNEIARLNDRVKELSIPSLTQICEDPKNLSHIDTVELLHKSEMEKKQLEKENANLLDTIKTNNLIDEYCAVAVGDKKEVAVGEEKQGKNKGKMRHPEPSSMAIRVKERSRREERKTIEMTPQLNTREIIEVHEDVDQRNEKKVRETRKKLQFDGKFDAVRRTKDKIKDAIIVYFEQHSSGYVVWDGLCVFSYVTVRDIISILHHDRISEAVIDSWSDALIAMYDEARYIRSTVIFTSKCWDLIYTKGPPQILQNLVDDKLETVGQFDVLIFPLLVKDFKGATRKMGDHWTILILNLGSCQWSFYNSIKTRRGESTDGHLVGANVVVEYVEKKLRKVFKGKYGCHSLLNKGTTKPESVTCVQQLPDSVDCGVIVCEHIENTLLRNPKKIGIYSKSKSGEYRSKMVSWFVDPASVRVKK
ncbi:hypothetical protein ACS0TY_016869 [Phlomoides rotata]